MLRKFRAVIAAAVLTLAVSPSGVAHANLYGCVATPIAGYTKVTATCTTHTAPGASQYRAGGYCNGIAPGFYYGPWRPVPYSSTTAVCAYGTFTSWFYQTA